MTSQNAAHAALAGLEAVLTDWPRRRGRPDLRYLARCIGVAPTG